MRDFIRTQRSPFNEGELPAMPDKLLSPVLLMKGKKTGLNSTDFVTRIE